MLATRRSGTPPRSMRPHSSRSGRTTPRFEVLERLGEGTLWITYRVQLRSNTPLAGQETDQPTAQVGQIFALKALRNTVNRISRLREALEETSHQRSKLLHSGLVTIREVGIEQDTLYILTDLLPGGSLEHRLARGALKPEDARNILRQLTLPLAYLHGQNVVHGDVRPRQVLFDAQGHPVLTDGGVAQAFARAGMTLADVQGEVAHYLAPERTQGGDFSAASDIYALGVTFYRMLTGRVPFDGPSALAIAARHRNDVVLAPSQLNPRVPGDLDDLTLRMLTKDPQQRPNIEQVLLTLRDKEEKQKPERKAKVAPPVAPTPVASATELSAGPPPVAATPVAAAAAATSVPPVAPTPPPVAASAVQSALDPKVPRRRPLDEIVEETLAKEAKQQKEQDIRKVQRRHRWREFYGLIGSILGLGILIGAGIGMAYGAYNYWLNDIPKEVVVPTYLNKDQEQAKQTLAKKGLFMKIVRETYDPRKPAGTVISGEPEPGRKVRARREVLVTVSAGQAPIRMVDFSRLSINQARQIIVRHGLRLGPVVEQYHDQVPAGFICGQFPEPGEPFRRSEAITLIVSRGKQPKEIDATTGAIWEAEVAPTPDPSQDQNLDTNNGEFAPLQPIKESLTEDGLIERTVKVSITVPKGTGNQLVRVIVQDARGERMAYQKMHPAGITITRSIKVVKAPQEIGQVRIYVGETLIREEDI